MENIELREFAGQKTTVAITKRDNGSVYVTFRSWEGYGYPTLELDKLKELVKKAEALQDESPIPTI